MSGAGAAKKTKAGGIIGKGLGYSAGRCSYVWPPNPPLRYVPLYKATSAGEHVKGESELAELAA